MRDGIVKTHRLFPTIVYELNYDKNEMVRRIVREDCMNYVVDGKTSEIENPFLHQNEKLIEFYFYISQFHRLLHYSSLRLKSSSLVSFLNRRHL